VKKGHRSDPSVGGSIPGMREWGRGGSGEKASGIRGIDKEVTVQQPWPDGVLLK